MSNHESLQATFNNLFEAESDSIFRFCLFRVSDKEQAMDLVQETFVRVWQTLQAGTAMNNPRAFLFTVAHRLIIDWYRKKKPVSLEAESEYEGMDAVTSTDPIDEKTSGDSLEMGAEGRYLMTKINQLNLSYRQAVYLRYVEGLSPPEIGEALGLSANAASVRINRGIKELRKLTGYEIEQKDPEIEENN